MFASFGPPAEWVYFVYIPVLLLLALVPTVTLRAWMAIRRQRRGDEPRSGFRSVVVFLLTFVGFTLLVAVAVPVTIVLVLG